MSIVIPSLVGLSLTSGGAPAPAPAPANPPHQKWSIFFANNQGYGPVSALARVRFHTTAGGTTEPARPSTTAVSGYEYPYVPDWLTDPSSYSGGGDIFVTGTPNHSNHAGQANRLIFLFPTPVVLGEMVLQPIGDEVDASPASIQIAWADGTDASDAGWNNVYAGTPDFGTNNNPITVTIPVHG